MKTEPDGKAKGRELCKVLFPYEAQNEDELSLKEGEIINIISKRAVCLQLLIRHPSGCRAGFRLLLFPLQECADAGWWKGEVGGRQGVFPDNFVKLLDVDKEVAPRSEDVEMSRCRKAGIQF
ncbi:SH3 domain-containing kinase-binding protein 1 [Liparis tanakae]|uniref:SH3 domain-containing kinase-binding protein 1 n=1 Tax=Liparis tanakae TaxID=230148 RepID=A0A4Z2E680_9TELE|nr:SH3 domain-containing kinase-binding protein 1 [Liparis tanakae]